MKSFSLKMKSFSLKMNNRAYAYSIIFLSISLILGDIEAMFPLNIGYVGVRIGLSNIITILGLKMLDTKKTFIINILRILILGMVFSNLIRFLISLAGFLLSFIVMYISLVRLNFSIVVSSILGGVFHNIGQVLMVAIVTNNPYALNLMYIYIIFGIISGLVIGLISDFCYKRLRKVIFE